MVEYYKQVVLWTFENITIDKLYDLGISVCLLLYTGLGLLYRTFLVVDLHRSRYVHSSVRSRERVSTGCCSRLITFSRVVIFLGMLNVEIGSA